MKQRSTAFRLLAVATLVACLAGTALSQDAEKDTVPFKPMFGHLPAHFNMDAAAETATPATALQIFVGSFIYKGTSYSYDMVGTAPSTGTSTTIPVYLIPLRMVYVGKTTTTFAPYHKLSNGRSVVQNTLDSPIFQTGIDFDQKSIDLGSTQYIDAFQRGNFWGTVKSHTGWHTLLGTPTVEPVQQLTVPAADGSVANEGGVTVGLADINWFDAQITAIITKLKLQPNALPIFLTYDTYLTQGGGCCIGGYHSATGSVTAPQTYSYFTYIDKVGAFAQDVSALSHEIGEWADDPYVGIDGKNNTPCGILEVGDPLEGNANFGGYPYTLNGFTYNLQDLVWLPYFGAPPITSAHGWSTFQGEPLTVCKNGS
jgi:hypothetical protein